MIKSPSSQTSQRKKQPYFLKLTGNKSSHNLSTSGLSNKSKTFFDNGVKLSDSYYNDRQNIYVTRSRALSQKSLSYQSKDISYSLRKKYNSKKIQNIVQKRQQVNESHLSNKTMSLPTMKFLNRQTIKGRINSLNARKFSQLVMRAKPIQKNMKSLDKQVAQKRQESSRQKKWSSPFKDTNSFKTKFQGKDLIPKKLSGITSNSNPSQLKVLNIDRMFRIKNGKLSNVVPIPLVKLSSVSSRPNLIKSIKKKDTIHEVIQEYNKLIRMSLMQKTVKKIGIRGHNFTRSPTLEELMGIKVHEYQKQNSIPAKQQQELNEDIFINYTQYYQKHMKKDIHLARRIISGIKRDGKLNLQAFTRFYAIFVNKIASLEDKIKFLLYFFIPHSQEKIQLEVLKLILELMCQKLPQISSLKAQSQFLTEQQKSKIFMEALNRVLFADIKQFAGNGQVQMNRSILQMILQRNEDAVSLLLRLLLLQ